MFHKNTKIVVIGSSVKRKAGPRVGSMGYVLHINNAQKTRLFPEIIVCSAAILFTRFGFEKKKRFEKVPVIIAGPDMQIYDNPKKAINKVIRNIQNINTSQIIVASPVEEDARNYNEVCAKILCKVTSPSFITMMRNLHDDNPFREKDPAQGNIIKMKEIMPDHVLRFILAFNKCRKLSQVREVVIKHYFLKPKKIKELFNIVNICEILEYKYINQNKISSSLSWRLNSGMGNTTIIGNLFNVRAFDSITLKSIKKGENERRTKYLNLATEIRNKGSFIINKHT